MTMPSDPHLTYLCEARAAAALACTDASKRAADLKAQLREYLAKRLRAGASPAQLRQTMLDAGLPPSVASELLCSVDGGRIGVQYRGSNPPQVDMFSRSASLTPSRTSG